MTDYSNATLVSDDWIPRFEDGGFDDLVRSVAPYGYSGNVLLTELNENNHLAYCGWEMLTQYLADRHLAGELTGIHVMDGPEAVGTDRYRAPSGIGTDGNGVWFSDPDTGTEILRWYVNGEKKVEREQDLATNRSATLAELEAASGDVVQVCVVAGGVVGWWGRIQIP